MCCNVVCRVVSGRCVGGCFQQLGDEIGKGGFGTVFKGLNVRTGDFVAIKRMSLRSVDKDEISSMQV